MNSVATAKQTKTAEPARNHSSMPHPSRDVTHQLTIPQEAGNLAIQSLFQAGRIQAKLEISQPNDPLEKEADDVAEQVMCMSLGETSPIIGSAGTSVQRMCTECEDDLIEQGNVQRKANGNGLTSDSSPSIKSSLSKTSGRPLDPVQRSFFEPRFNQDFGKVRLHTDENSAKTANSINARAFTINDQIAFAPGQYNPGSTDGKRLLAHELTHVVQQGVPVSDLFKSKIQRQPDAGVSDAEPIDAGVSDAGPIDAGGVGLTRRHKGEIVSSDKAYTYEQLKRIYIDDGYEKMQNFVIDFKVDVVLPRKPIAGVSDDPELIRDIAILETLNEQYEKLDKETNEFIKKFESQARSIVESALEESQQNVLAESVRYGVSNLRFESTWYGGLTIKGDVADNASTRGIAIAAQGLLDRKKKVDKAQAEYDRFAQAMNSPMAKHRSGLQHYEISIHLSELRGPIRQAQRQLDVFRYQVQMKFPLLGALSSDKDFMRGELQDLAKGSKGKDSGTTKVIVDQIIEKLVNIAKVRKELKPGGDVNIWRVPSIIEGTKIVLGATPGTLLGRIADDKTEDEKPSWITGILIGILQLGLVLLAPATGGLSLIPAAGISVVTAYQHFKEYQIKKAMHGTDFGAAALSAEDPSLFWLAVDIIGAGLDVTAAGGAAFRVFRKLAPSARAVRGAQAGEDAVRTLERNARELGGEALARSVGRDARSLQSGFKREVGITADEALKFEQAATDIAAKELRVGAQKTKTLAGGEVTVSRSGAVFSCNSPCTMMRERYKDLLVREPKYIRRLNELEERARKLTTGAEDDIARKQIANEAAALEREMRTTSLPGDWTSPIKESSGYNELVKRRGSVAAILDHHPPGWTGKDEAFFRYGASAEAETGYRWTMQNNGTLRYDRLDASLKPHSYNSATGIFEEAAEEGLIRATKGAEEVREFANLPKKTRESMEAAFKNRRNLMVERDRLETLKEAGTIGAEDAKKLRKLYAEINEESRLLGEHAAEGVMSAKGGIKLYPLTKTHSTSGDFDQVWKMGDEFHVVEAKGGSGSLGSRSVGEGMRAQQGTIEYAKSIAANMKTNGATKEIRQLGRELEAAILEGKVKYVLVRAPIGTKAGASVLSDVKVSEFVY